MLVERSLIALPYLAVANSIYLSFINFESFLTEKNIDKMAAGLGSIFALNIFVIVFVIAFNNLRKKLESKEMKWFLIFKNHFKAKILSLIMIFFLLLFFFTFLKSDTNNLLITSVLVGIEITSISFAIANKRKKAVEKLIGYVICGMYLLMMPFTLFGFCEQYLGYNEFQNPNLILVFTAIFYHLLSACYMFYEALPKSLTKYDFKEDKRKPKKIKAVIKII